MRPAPPTDQTLAPSESDTPGWEVTPASEAGVHVPTQERYSVRGEIARGGLGRVLAAEDTALGRPVALKELLHDSPGNRARFLREIRLTARLQHPSIVPIYDAVTGADGVIRYTMKLVAGGARTLGDAIRSAGSFEARLALLPHILAVADAVAYAHDRGVIHRDIKPDNILLGHFGETLLIDWGVAKDLGDAEEELAVEAESADAGLTRVGAIVGTPAYMSPEQARGEPADRRSDVYALGATLYHLLAGEPPFRSAADQTVDALRSGQAPPSVEARIPEVPPDLASIVRRAMEPAPAARYASGLELRQDLQRFSTGQLVAARHYTSGDLVRRWLRRHRAVASVVVLATIVVTVAGAVATARVIEERNIARGAQAVAEARSNALTLAYAGRSVDADPTEAVSWLLQYPTDGEDPNRLFTLAQDVVARGLARVTARPPYVGCERAVYSGDGQTVFAVGEGAARVDVTTGAILTRSDFGQADAVVAVGPDAVLVAAPSGLVYRLDREGGRAELATLPAAPAHLVSDAAVAIVGDRVGGITRIDLQTRETQVLLTTPVRINGLVRHGDAWSAISGDGSVWTGSMGGGAPTLRLRGEVALLQLVALEDGTLIVGDEAGRVTRIARSGDTTPLLTLPGQVRLLALGDEGRLLVAADGAGTTRAVALGGGEVDVPPWGQALALGLTVAPDDGVVAAVLEDGTLHAWRPSTGDEQVRRERSKLAGPVVFAPDGATLATCTVDSGLQIWPTPELRARVHRGHNGRIFHPIFLPDGRVATDSDDQTVRVWPADGGEALVLRGHTDQIYGIEASPDGRHLVSASNDGLAIVWDVSTGASQPLRGHEGRVRRAVFSSDGQHVYTGGRDGTLRSWSLDGTLERTTDAHPGGVHWIALADDGTHVWSVGRDRTLRRWDPRSGALESLPTPLGVDGAPVLRVFPLAEDRVLTCPDARTLIIADINRVIQTFPAPEEIGCASVELSPDRRYAAVPVGQSVSVVELSNGAWRRFAPLPDEVHSVAWSPDARLLALAGLDGTARVVRVEDGAAAVITRSAAGLLGVRFSRDSQSLAAGGLEHVLWVAPVDEASLLPPDPAALLARLSTLTRARLPQD